MRQRSLFGEGEGVSGHSVQKPPFSSGGEGFMDKVSKNLPPPVSLDAEPIVSPLDADQWGVFALPDLLGTLWAHGLIVVKRDWLTEDMAIDDCRVAEMLEDDR